MPIVVGSGGDGADASFGTVSGDIALNSGSFSKFGPLVAPGGDGAVEALDPPDYGSGGSGGGHSAEGTGNDGGTGGSDAFGDMAGLGQGTREFDRAIDVRGVSGVQLTAGRGGTGGVCSQAQCQGGGGGGGLGKAPSSIPFRPLPTHRKSASSAPHRRFPMVFAWDAFSSSLHTAVSQNDRA